MIDEELEETSPCFGGEIGDMAGESRFDDAIDRGDIWGDAGDKNGDDEDGNWALGWGTSGDKHMECNELIFGLDNGEWIGVDDVMPVDMNCLDDIFWADNDVVWRIDEE